MGAVDEQLLRARNRGSRRCRRPCTPRRRRHGRHRPQRRVQRAHRLIRRRSRTGRSQPFLVTPRLPREARPRVREIGRDHEMLQDRAFRRSGRPRSTGRRSSPRTSRNVLPASFRRFRNTTASRLSSPPMPPPGFLPTIFRLSRCRHARGQIITSLPFPRSNSAWARTSVDRDRDGLDAAMRRQREPWPRPRAAVTGWRGSVPRLACRWRDCAASNTSRPMIARVGRLISRVESSGDRAITTASGRSE